MAPRSGEDQSQTPIDAPKDTLGLVPLISEPQDQEDVLPPMKFVWRNIILMSLLHLGAIYSIWLIPQAKISTLIFTFVLYHLSVYGITAGAHRLWSHRSYKAKLPLRILLVIFNSIAFQNDVIEWARDHRVHHKFSETNADPHNAKRGFFFSHVGWLLCRKHPDVRKKGKMLDISDLLADPVLRIQRKVYVPSVLLLCFVMPTVVPWYFFGESLFNAYCLCVLFRYAAVLNATWFVNSLAHMFGEKPYDVRINPVENIIVAFFALGEGFHNYHHTFPQDYAAAEFGWLLNSSTAFIDFFALIGWAYDRKTMPKPFVEARKKRTGVNSPLVTGEPEPIETKETKAS